MWLPCLIAGAPLAAACARMAAGTLRAVLADDALRTARAKGATEGRVLRRHALPLAAPPVIALVAVNMNLLVTNVALMEAVFNIPGSFRFIERALINRDVDLAQALVVEATVLIVHGELPRRRGPRLAGSAGALTLVFAAAPPRPVRRSSLRGGGLLGPVAVQAPVGALAAEQLLVRALLDDAAVVEHDDVAGAADGGEAVGDHDRRAAGEQPPQAGLDPALRVDVDVRGRLVEDEDARIGGERAREGDELALAGRELDAALADLGVVAVLERGDEVVRADGARGRLDVLARRVRRGRRRCCRGPCR